MMHNDYDAPDDIYEEDIYNAGGGLRWMSILVVLLVVFGFFSLALYAYKINSSTNSSGDEVMFVDADDSPIKEKPEDPGGMKFGNQDKQVYETITSANQPKSVTHYFDDEEEVVARADAAKNTAKNAAENMVTEVIELDAGNANNEATTEIKPIKKADDLAMVIAKNDSPKLIVKKKVETVKHIKKAPAKAVSKAKPAKKAVKKSTGKYQLQLAALRSYGDAQKMWKKIYAKHKSVLSGKSHRIVKAAVKGKGTFYRLRATGFASKAAAARACSKLKARGQSCLVP